MSSISFQPDATFTSVSAPAKVSSAKLDAVAQCKTSDMHADDAAALRIVSAIIFTVVALATLAMLATVLICN